MPVINNPEKQKNLINEKGQYKIDFPENSTDNNQMKYIDRDSYFTEESFERLKPKIGVNLDEEYNTEENILEKEENEIEREYLEEDQDDIINISEEEQLKAKKFKKRMEGSKLYQELNKKNLSYEDKVSIFKTNEEMSNLKGTIIGIIHKIFKELYGNNKAINTENPDIKYIWDTVSETRKNSSNYVKEITKYLNANKILGSCMKKLRDGQKEEVYKKLKSLYRSGHDSHDIVTSYKEYEEMLKILQS